MLDHHLQRSIVFDLAFTSQARFSELKPADVENKLFTYHLKKVMLAGYVEKNSNSQYSLTPEGRRLGYQAAKKNQFLIDKAYSVLFLIVRRKADGAWLLHTRGIHPLFGFITFPVATPVVDVTAVEAAQHDLLTKTGLNGSFTALGGGFYHVFSDDQLESFTNFTLLVCEDATGELQQLDENGTYEWISNPDFTSPTMLSSVARLVEMYEKNEPFFLEETIKL